MTDQRNRTIVRARELRRTMSVPETELWQALRKLPDGFKFRRQHPIDPYVLDFYCPAVRLAVEVDRSSHDFGGRPARDAARDVFLQAQGIKTLRIPAKDVLRDVENVVRHILDVCRA